MKKLIYLVFCIVLLACSTDKNPNQIEDVSQKAQEIIDKAIASHGGQLLMGKSVEFDFRQRHYSAVRTPDRFVYTRSWQDDSLGFVQDTLVNSIDHTQYRDGTEVALNEEWHGRYGNSVNSVLYFTQLPFGLNDPAVRKTYLDEVKINDKVYHKIKVTFAQEGGGDDFEDVYIYWIDAEGFTMDYLAYEYHTEGGGVRFREAINRRTIEGIVFQDYINYKPQEKGMPVTQTDSLFEAGALQELSRIINENIVVEPIS